MFRKSLIAALVLAAAPQLLWAHAHVGTATPAKDAVLAKTPATVTLTLTEGLEAAFSSLTLQDAAGKTVPTEKSALAPGDNKTLVLPIGKDLPAGVYTVKWQALSRTATRPMAPGRSRSSPEAACKLRRRRRAQAMIIATFALLRFVAYMASTLLFGASAMLALSGSRGEAVRRGGLAQGVARRLGGRNAVRAVSPAIANRQHRRRMAAMAQTDMLANVALQTRYGQAWILRAAAMLLVLCLFLRPRPDWTWRARSPRAWPCCRWR